MSEEEKEKLKEEVLAQIRKEGWVTDFISITQTIKVAFDYESNEQTEFCIETLEEAKRKIRELQASLIKGRTIPTMCEMSMQRFKSYT